LTTALLARCPLQRLLTLDRYALRRERSLTLGAHVSLDASEPAVIDRVQTALRQDSANDGADLTYELSGNPAALDQAIAVTGFHGRVIIGSWYGQKLTHVQLGGRFHRSRIRLMSSQVSTIAPELSGRWSTSRRLHVAWQMLQQVRPASLITHRVPFAQAAEAYALLDQHPGEAIQVMLTYED
jgi:threonine dehydrogenase-like Zn-dependent dehydrogenase